jgi:hypothetical protein
MNLDGDIEDGGCEGKATKLFEAMLVLVAGIYSRVDRTKPVKKPIFNAVFGVAELSDCFVGADGNSDISAQIVPDHRSFPSWQLNSSA